MTILHDKYVLDQHIKRNNSKTKKKLKNPIAADI